MIIPWKQLTHRQPSQFRPAIMYIHHAAQIVASVGNSLLPAEADDSQSSLEWLPGINALAGRLINEKYRAALRYLPFELLVLDDENRIQEAVSIPGLTVARLYKWLQHAVIRAGGAGKQIKPITHFEIPDHLVAQGVAFPEIDPATHRELADYRFNADWVSGEITGLYPQRSSPVLVWPHHFDTGAVITLERDDQGEATKTIGIGLAMPDTNFEEPYFYTNHWRAAGELDYAELPELEGKGRWYLEQWKGTVLPASDVVRQRSAAEQQQVVLQFFRSSIRSVKQLLIR